MAVSKKVERVRRASAPAPTMVEYWRGTFAATRSLRAFVCCWLTKTPLRGAVTSRLASWPGVTEILSGKNWIVSSAAISSAVRDAMTIFRQSPQRFQTMSARLRFFLSEARLDNEV
jgi:hypothetical protein